MEYPKRLVEAEARKKSAFRKEKRTSDVWRSSTEPQPSSEEPERQPRKGDKLDRTPYHKKLRGQRKNSGECEDPALQNKNLKDRDAILKRQRRTNSDPAPGRHPCQEEGTLPGATPVPLRHKQKSRPHARERSEVENLRHPERTPAAHTEKSDFRKNR